jgi:hypothetical protein
LRQARSRHQTGFSLGQAGPAHEGLLNASVLLAVIVVFLIVVVLIYLIAY